MNDIEKVTLKRKVVFLDRDGVLNVDPGEVTETGYVASPEELRLLSGAPEAIKLFSTAGYEIVIISNQQGVGKGLFSESDLFAVTSRLKRELEKSGGQISGIYYCIHLAEDKCRCRKPAPGLFEKAKKDLDLKELRGYYYIGDTERDIVAGEAAGLKTVAVASGKSDRDEIDRWGHRPDVVCEDILSAAKFITADEKEERI